MIGGVSWNIMNPRRFNVEPPTGRVRGAWRQVASAMCRLMKQFIPPMANPTPGPTLLVPIPPAGLPPGPPAAHWLGAGRAGPGTARMSEVEIRRERNCNRILKVY